LISHSDFLPSKVCLVRHRLVAFLSAFKVSFTFAAFFPPPDSHIHRARLLTANSRSFTMLASPLYPASSFSPQQNQDTHSQYRPARDLEAFNSLLPPPIEFIEGSSSGLLAVAEGKYTPINVTPKTPKADVCSNCAFLYC
jgi:hypothetical protein